jgi:hypothetical protein
VETRRSQIPEINYVLEAAGVACVQARVVPIGSTVPLQVETTKGAWCKRPVRIGRDRICLIQLDNCGVSSNEFTVILADLIS